MSPLLIIVIPFTLILVGIMLNSFHIVHDQPVFSLEEDPAHKLAAERQAHSRFFQQQRQRALRRQKHVGQYGWLVLAVFITSSWFLYADAVRANDAVEASQRHSNLRRIQRQRDGLVADAERRQ